MVILKRTIYAYSLPFSGGRREGFILCLQRDNGQVGWGEVAPLPGFSQETLEEALEDLIEGKESKHPSVQWGLAAAMLDLLQPLEVDSIPVRNLEKEKIKLGHLTLNKAIEKAENSNCTVVDMNQGWSLRAALDFAGRFPQIELFEEPLKLSENARSFPYPVALDESLRQRNTPAYPNVKAHVIKPMLHGYPLPQKVKGVDFILSSSYESEIGIYQIAKLAYRLKIPLIPMGLGTGHLFEDSLFEERSRVENGRLYFPKKWNLKKDKVQVVFDGCV